MLQLLPQNTILSPESYSPVEAIKFINSYIDNYHCENLNVDISFMNIIDASYVSTMCSTKHFIKYPDGQINWKVNSDIVKKFNKSFELCNCSYEV